MSSEAVVQRLHRRNIGEMEVKAMCSLLSQLKGEKVEVSLTRIQKVADENCLVVARMKADASIIGMATLIVTNHFSTTVGRVETVVVDEEYRGRGLARAIMGHLIELAQQFGVQRLELTSNPSRTSAHALYRSLGFEVRDTAVFRLELK